MKILRGRDKKFESLGEKIAKPVLTITIGVLLVCQIGSFAIACQWIRRRNMEIVDSQLKYVEYSVREKTMDIQRMLFGIQVNDTFVQALSRLVFNEDENPVYAQSQISSVLAVSKGTMPLVSNIYICSPDLLVTDMTTLCDGTKNYKKSRAYELYENSPDSIFFGTAGTDDIFITKRNMIPVGYRYQMAGYGEPIAIIANIDQERLNGFLRHDIGGQGLIGLVDEDGRLIAWNQKPEEENGREAIAEQLIHKTMECQEGEQKIFREGVYIVGSRPISGTPWRVIYITSEQKELQVLWGMGFFYVLVSGAAVWVMISFVRKKILGLMRPLKELAAAMSDLEDWKEEPDLSYRGNDEIRILFDSFTHMIQNTRHYILCLEEEKQRVKAEQVQKRKAEFKALQAQIQPHFLYNTLESIHWKAEEAQVWEISEMVQALATFFRINLSRGREMILLRDEIAHVESYLRIQKIRYGEQLEYTITAADEVLQTVLPKLILQPLVENSIYHGIREKDGKGLIRITAERAGSDTVLLRVEDDGRGIPPEQLRHLQDRLVSGENVHQEGYGIFNVNQRIQLNYGSQFGLTVQSEENVQTVVEIRIPSVTENGVADYVQDLGGR